MRTAFDHGLTHFHLANNYGPPYRAAEIQFGYVLEREFKPYRDEIMISKKAGYDTWPGPYESGESRKYLLSSLDQSLARMNLDYVDIFYSHRVDPETPLEETMGALASAVRQGKALYAGISDLTIEAWKILHSMGVPCLIHQPSCSLFNRWVEKSELLETLEQHNIGVIVFSPLAQGLLTDKYLRSVPEDSRAGSLGSFNANHITEEVRNPLIGLQKITSDRNQSLAQLSISWVLRPPIVSSALIGVRTKNQLLDVIQATDHLEFTESDLLGIDQYSNEFRLNVWAESSNKTIEDMP